MRLLSSSFARLALAVVAGSLAVFLYRGRGSSDLKAGCALEVSPSFLSKDVYEEDLAIPYTFSNSAPTADASSSPDANSGWQMVDPTVAYTSGDAETKFQDETGFKVPESWLFVRGGDTHGGLMGDGESFAVYELNKKDLGTLVGNNSPWSNKWLTGPVPHEIGVHYRFGNTSDELSGFISVDDGPKEYHGHPETVSILSSQNSVCDAKERCDNPPWHNGHLLVVDRENRRIYLSVWDF